MLHSCEKQSADTGGDAAGLGDEVVQKATAQPSFWSFIR